jgi:hypothetical protein
MDHVLSSKTVVGQGASSIVLEVKGRSVRIKRRGMPDLFLPLDAAPEVARFLLAACAPPLVRA